MQRDPIALGIDDHRAKAVFSDFLSRSQNFTAVRARSFDRLIEPAFDQQINQRTICRGPIIDAAAVTANAKTTRRILLFVRQQTVIHSAIRQLLYLFAKHGGIKLDCAIKIHDRNVRPAKCVSGHVEIVVSL